MKLSNNLLPEINLFAPPQLSERSLEGVVVSLLILLCHCDEILSKLVLTAFCSEVFFPQNLGQMAERPPHHNSSEFDPSLLKVGGEPPSAADLEISGRQRRLWNLFQHTATSLTHLYKCKSKCHQNAEDQETWLAFQSAASTLT